MCLKKEQLYAVLITLLYITCGHLAPMLPLSAMPLLPMLLPFLLGFLSLLLLLISVLILLMLLLFLLALSFPSLIQLMTPLFSTAPLVLSPQSPLIIKMVVITMPPVSPKMPIKMRIVRPMIMPPMPMENNDIASPERLDKDAAIQTSSSPITVYIPPAWLIIIYCNVHLLINWHTPHIADTTYRDNTHDC